MGKQQKRHIQGRKGEIFAERLQGVAREQVLVVAIDVAKFNPKALVCDFFGTVLEEPFVVLMTEPGFVHLQARIEHWRRELPAARVLVGLESTGHYHQPLVRSLQGSGYDVIILNPGTTASRRPVSEMRHELRLLQYRLDDLDVLDQRIKDLEDLLEALRHDPRAVRSHQ